MIARDSKVLVFAELTTLDSETCTENLNSNYADLFCGGREDTQGDPNKGYAVTCEYDSGGPFMSNQGSAEEPDWLVAGVLSSEPESPPKRPSCGPGSVADSWVNVSNYADWIDTLVK